MSSLEKPGPQKHIEPGYSAMSPDGRTRTEVWHAGTPEAKRIVDTHAFLEDPKDPDTVKWLAQQNDSMQEFLAQVDPETLLRIQESVDRAHNYEEAPCPNPNGIYTYQTRQKPGQVQPVHYYYSKGDDINGEGHILLDPNEVDPEGKVSFNWYYPEKEGRYVAYVQTDARTKTHNLRVRNIATGIDLEENIPNTSHTYVSWLPDASGFYYMRYPDGEGIDTKDPRYVRGTYFHTLDTSTEEDKLVYSTGNVQAGSAYVFIHPDGEYKVAGILSQYGTKQMLISHFNYETSTENFTEVYNQPDTDIQYVGINNGYFYAIKSEPTRKAVLIRLKLADGLHEGMNDEWEELAADENDFIDSAQFIGDKLVINYLHNATSRISVIDTKTGNNYDLQIPPMTTATIKGSEDSNIAYMSVESFITPPQLFRVNISTGTIEPIQEKRVPFNEGDFTTEQVTYKSEDGTDVDMFLVQNNTARANGEKRLLLSVYGGFRHKRTPKYDPLLAAALDQGYILAVPNIRGGGEKGTPWHTAGRGPNKANTFKDVYAARDYLINNGITTKLQLALIGRSAGGYAASVALTQRPELWAAVVAHAPITNAVHFNLQGKGGPWVDEFGDPNKPKEFAYLHSTSPIHNVHNNVSYPPALFVTGDIDTTVVPPNSYKLVAELQKASGAQNKTMLYVYPGGHREGIPKPVEKATDTAKLAWLNAQLS